LARVLLAGDEQHLADADALEQLQRVVDHRPATDRQQVLVRDAGQLLEARRVAAGGDQPLHAADATAASASWPRAAAKPRTPATTPTAATHVHMVASPYAWRTCRPRNGVSAQPTAHVPPYAPMYAPRMSAGASAATTACDVGTHSISPSTKTAMTSATTGTEPSTFRSRNGTPIIGIARPSFTDAGTRATRRVSRSWKSVTDTGFRIIRNPQAAGARWCVVVTEIGSNVSVATYVAVAKTDETMKSRNVESCAITRKEPRSGGPAGAYRPRRGM